MQLDSAAAGMVVISATPFTAAGALDLDSTASLMDFYTGCGVTGMTILGIMGEAPKLAGDESMTFVKACLEGDFTRAREWQRKCLPLMEVNFVESNPIPVKAAMGLMGLLEPVYRLPLCPPKPENLAKIEKVLEAAGFLAGRGARVAS